jgi:peptidoglycan/LPS O-acetylase OafA/YrhL
MSPMVMSRLLFTRVDSLLFGAGVALLVRTPSPRRRPARRILAGAALVLSVCLFAAHGPDASSVWLATVGYSAIAAFCASVIYLAREGDALIAKLFDRSFLRFFGRYSYGLYLFHGIYFVYLRHLSGSLQGRVHSGLLAQLLIVGFGFAVSVALAVLSYHVFEFPFLKLKNRFT